MNKKVWLIALGLGLLGCEKKEPPSVLTIDSLEPTALVKVTSDADYGGVGADLTTAIAPTESDPLVTDATNTVVTESDAATTIVEKLLPVSPFAADVEDISSANRIVQFYVNSDYIESCVGEGLLSGIRCSLAGFYVNLSDVFLNATVSPKLNIRGTTHAGKTVESSTYTAKLFDVRRLSNNASAGDNVNNLVAFNDKLYFRSKYGASGGYRTFSTDGTAVSLLSTRTVDVNVDNMSPVGVLGSKLILTGREDVAASANQRLYTYDGTSLLQVSDFTPIDDGESTYAVTFGTDMYFTGDDGAGTSNLFRFNGTRFQKTTSVLSAGHPLVPRAATSKWLYFTKYTGTSNQLYRTNFDSAVASERLLIQMTSGFTIDPASTYFVLNDELYFNGASPTVGLYRVTEAGVEHVNATPFLATTVTKKGIAYGVQFNGTTYDLVRFDGTELQRLTSGTFSLDPSTKLTADGEDIYFSAKNGAVYEGYRYHESRLEKLFSFDEVSTTAGANSTRATFFNGEFYFVLNQTSAKSLYRMEQL